jgi:hypothetical protein
LEQQELPCTSDIRDPFWAHETKVKGRTVAESSANIPTQMSGNVQEKAGWLRESLGHSFVVLIISPELIDS